LPGHANLLAEELTQTGLKGEFNFAALIMTSAAAFQRQGFQDSTDLEIPLAGWRSDKGLACLLRMIFWLLSQKSA